MAVPEFNYFIKPALAFHKDAEPKHLQEVYTGLVAEFHFTAADLEILVPSGRKSRVFDRVQWALTYLRQAGLIESVGRGINRITQRGEDYLPICPQVVKPSDLMVFPEFVAFQTRTSSSNDNAPSGLPKSKLLADVTVTDKITPEEAIASAFKSITEALAQEVLDRVKSMPPAFFERLIVQLMLKLGYGGGAAEAGEAIGKSGDGGVDGVISEDKLGLDKIYLQAKRWDNGTVGSKEVQAFVGALHGQSSSKGVFITTSTFSKQAKEYVHSVPSFKISLIEGIELARLLIDYDLGVSLVQRYDVKRIDSDFFAEQ